MGSSHPSASIRERSIVVAGDAKLLEAFDGADYVDDRIHRSDLVERNPLGRQSVHPTFRFSEQPECAHRSFPNPGRQTRLFHYRDQVADMPVSSVPCSVIVMMRRGVLIGVGGAVDYFGGLLART